MADEIFAGQPADVGLGFVDHDDLVGIDDHVERDHDHVGRRGAVHDRTIRRRVVGDHDDRVVAGVDELIDRADLRGHILADADHFEFCHVRLHVRLLDIGLGGLHHLDAPRIADIAVDEGDAERAFLAGYCRYFTLASRGAKHSGSAPGPLTSWGPAMALPANKAARARTEIPPKPPASARDLVFTATSSLVRGGMTPRLTP